MRAILKFIGVGILILFGLGWWTSTQVEDTPRTPRATEARTTERDSAYVAAILVAFNEMAGAHDDMSHVTLDGSIMDVHYSRRLSKSEFLADVRGVSASFSKKKGELLGASAVTVRAVHDGYIMAQASARKGQVTESE